MTSWLECFSVLLLAGTVLAAAPTCKKINDCACTPTDANQTGVINFFPMVSSNGAKPAYMVNGTSKQTKNAYTFYYNPCMSFNMTSSTPDQCTNQLICQELMPSKWTYALGAHTSVSFAYVNNMLIAYYYSKSTNNRTSEVRLICDENETHGKFVYVDEPKSLYYQFNFTSMCACPGKCPNKTLVPDKWIETNRCLYRQMTSGKLVNLQGLATPLKVATNEHTTYYYSPCNGLELGSLDEKCKDAAVCKQDMSTSPPTYTGIGSEKVEVTEDDGDIVLHYPATTDGGKCFDVKLICDQSADDPILTSADDKNMILKAKVACSQ
ncbi:uncharacterized protein [Dysidea avara]|uniref:uncharacterized protein n=1 Tax=Dysidea avara TaxID=196820 RepID=UPI003327AA01